MNRRSFIAGTARSEAPLDCRIAADRLPKGNVTFASGSTVGFDGLSPA